MMSEATRIGVYNSIWDNQINAAILDTSGDTHHNINFN